MKGGSDTVLQMVSRSGLGLVIAIAACGRIGFEATDIPPADDAPVDAPPVAPCTVADCPAPFVVQDGGCYLVGSEALGWVAAQARCAEVGAHLLVTDSVAEHFTIHALTAGIQQVWIGWSDRVVDGEFRWIAENDNGPTVNSSCFFPGGEPTAGDNDHCVAAQGTNACGDHFDLDCELALPFVCECDGRLADPSTF